MKDAKIKPLDVPPQRGLQRRRFLASIYLLPSPVLKIVGRAGKIKTSGYGQTNSNLLLFISMIFDNRNYNFWRGRFVPL